MSGQQSSILDLPIDILYLFLEMLVYDPPALEAFALSCKHIRHIAGRALEGSNALDRRWYDVNMNCSPIFIDSAGLSYSIIPSET